MEPGLSQLSSLVARWRRGSQHHSETGSLLGEIQRCTEALTAEEACARRRTAGPHPDTAARAEDTAVLRRLVAEKDALLFAFAGELRARHEALAEALGRQKQRVAALSRAEAAPVEPAELIAYAQKVRGFGFAPRGWEFNQPVRGFHLPSPQEEHMRRSVLWASSSSSSSSGGGGGGGGNDGAVATVEQEGGAAGSGTAAVQDGRPPGCKPGDPIPLPAGGPPPGWKPGDPIALPTIELPPGWKPGDPIVLPAAPNPQPVAAASAPTAPKPAPAKSGAGFSLDFSSSSSDDSDSDGSARILTPAAKRSRQN